MASPLAANVSIQEIIEDTHTRTVVRLVYFRNTAPSEQDALAVNANAVIGRTVAFTVPPNTSLGQSGFVVGETVTGNGSGATGFVQNWLAPTAANGKLTIGIVSGTFANTDIFTASLSSYTATANGAAQYPTLVMDIESIWYDVSQGTMAALYFSNSTVNTVAVTLCGAGYFGRNAGAGTNIPNLVVQTDGNLYVATSNVSALSGRGYSMIVELRKVKGYASPVGY